MKQIKTFLYFKSFYAIEMENKEFAIFTDKAMLPVDGSTYHLSVLSSIVASPAEDGWYLNALFICGNRQVSLGLYKGAEAEAREFCERANKLILATHHNLPQ